MGAKQSKLKKEIAVLKAENQASAAKHRQDVETLRNEKRMLEFKLHALQEMTAKAQVEAETATQLAVEHEQRAKALKWELVRRLSVPTTTSTSPATTLTASTSSSISSLASSPSAMLISAIPRVPVSWTLKEGTTLRRSNTSISTKRSIPEREPLSNNLKKPVGSSPLATRDQPVPLAMVQPQTKPQDHIPSARTGSGKKLPANNQEDGAIPPPLKPVVSQPARTSPPNAATSAATPTAPSIAPAPIATAEANFDLFAPVKRRSSTRDSIVTIASSVAAEAKDGASERVDSFNRSTDSAKESSNSGSDSDREPVRKSHSSSQDGEQHAMRRSSGQNSRGVHASTKGRAPSERKPDDVLALSDDEDD